MSYHGPMGGSAPTGYHPQQPHESWPATGLAQPPGYPTAVPSQPPGYPTAVPSQPPGYPPQQRARRRGLLIALAAGATLLLCFAGVAVIAAGQDKPGGGSTPSPSATQPAPRETDGAARAKIGDCLNIYSMPDFGTGGPNQSASPRMVTATERVACQAGTYEVLQRITATIDTNRCRSVPGSDSAYTADDPKSTAADYILCLKKR